MDLPSPLFNPSEREALKDYLAKLLAPICDADVNLLGDYILALLTHDNASPTEIRELCLRQLEDFLRVDTSAFVQDLFEALRCKSFLSFPAHQTQPVAKKRPNDQPSGPCSKKVARYSSDQQGRNGTSSFQFPDGPADFSNPWPSLVPFPVWGNGMQQPQRTGKCRDYEEKGFCMRGDTCPFDHGTDRIIVNGSENPQVPLDSAGAYDPANGLLPGRRSTQGIRGRGRGTIRGPRGGMNGSHISQQSRPPLPPRGPNYDESITSLIVQNIPAEKLDQSLVEQFFSNFGTLESLTMQPEFNQAVIKFAKYHDAKRAYDSPEPIFNNRFVKVFWERKSDIRSRRPSFSKKPIIPPSTPTQSPQDLAKLIQLKQTEFEARQAKKKERELKLAEIERQKRELLEKQARQQRELDELLAKQKNHKVDSKIAEPPLSHQGETEITVQKSGTTKSTGDVLRAQLQALQAEAAELGIDAAQATRAYPFSRGRGYRGGRGGLASRGRAPLGSKKLDNRPKSITITQIPSGTDEQLCQFLFQIGDYESITKESDQQTVHFKERWIAENFMASNGNIPGVGQVKLSWTSTSPCHESMFPADDDEGDRKEHEENHMDDEDGERRWKG
ncbi:putative RNA-binding protein [Neolecta irregularis DAH-3]|uniref:Putative RNA-binding protein n=1 Tax=Neolecta irregularis (strain DAH-3) TaxID=1198029 RepID=A0A1U7LL04_NEOID|nr:putative RNA-binding protein [Neolecta irregularis DAH-3]|eukprot:OLL23222.1 putative RNA-binding protein [Neolecta irregularis DAH-3]